MDDFLYEITALASIPGAASASGPTSVIELEAVIINKKEQLIKGILISYAPLGPQIDLIFNYKEDGQTSLPWEQCEKWARQIVNGLHNIHEAGFVQV